MPRYEMILRNYKNNKSTEYFKSRKQAYNFIMSNMLLQNLYQSALLTDLTTGEIWLEINWRGQDNYRKRG